jgi:nucleoside-triphosphatase THEP1
MSVAVILHGPIGCGKTMTCHGLVDKAQEAGFPIGGVITNRHFVEGKLIGYDCVDLSTGESFPIARLSDEVEGADWFVYRNLKFSFSHSGFDRANNILTAASEYLKKPGLVFVDEFGRLERKGLGLFSGVMKVTDALREGGVAVFSCRTDLAENVTKLLRGKAMMIYRREPGNLDSLWNIVVKRLV